MRPTSMPRILLVGDTIPDDTRMPLEAAGFPVSTAAYAGIDPNEVSRAQLVIFEVTPQTATMAQALCRRWRIDLGEHYIPFIWICFDSSPVLQSGALDAGADVCIPRPLTPSHLLAQAKALLRVQHLNARLAGRASEAQQINTRLQQAYQQIDNDLEMARRIHRGFLPRTMPEVHQARFDVCYRPRSRVGGDFYDVLRLDEEHVGIYIADAMGRGLPASSLLSIFLKKSMKVKEITGRSYRLIPPGEVLAGLNRELVALGLPEPPLVTMLYMQLNCRDGAVSFARASHPLPLLIPATGELDYLSASGTLLGVFESDYPDQSVQLKPGDKLLLFSDGVNTDNGNAASGSDRLLEVARKFRAEPLPSFLAEVSQDLLEHSRNTEDFTMIGVEYR
ncbi:MAG: SpoIIE family protein phosphatase [Planctomycetes bacterium]|nr:SpoIIE family protein phosphatase [Planctomycetota bacterium]